MKRQDMAETDFVHGKLQLSAFNMHIDREHEPCKLPCVLV